MIVDGAIEVVDTAATVFFAVADDDDGIVRGVVGHIVEIPHA